MRVAIVTESFLPTVNGVTNSVCKVLDHLADTGHEAIVIAPAAGAPASYRGFVVHEVPAVAYRQFPVGIPSPQVAKAIERFRPDVVHAASPFVLGPQGIAAANRLGIPSVAVFQTDMAGYARRNGLGASGARVAWRWIKWIHDGADLTLAPSTASRRDLERAGVQRIALWGRGVDLARYHPNNRLGPRASALHSLLAGPRGDVVVGYVGRVAPEKQVERFAALEGMRGVHVAIVGDGPSDARVRSALRDVPTTYLGRLTGSELADAYAAFDVFAHTGTEETFGQTLQEAHASGLPVVAPASGGPLDLVAHGVDGYLFDPRSAADFRMHVGALVGDAAMRSRMGEAGRRAVISRSWASVCDELLGHYRSAMARSGSGRRAPARSQA